MKRKTFFRNTLGVLGGVALPLSLPATPKTSMLRFGIVTDLHYAEKEPAIGRYYRQSIKKLQECVQVMNKEKVDFLIEIGDLKDTSFSGT